jgi:predicted dehydrogenase
VTAPDTATGRESVEDPVDVGVVGVGSMGADHVRVYRQLPGVRLVGVVDADEERATEVARANGTRSTSLDHLCRDADAVSIAVPTAYHHETARDCIEAGVDVLVEKPFVEDLQNGLDLIRRAEAQDAVLQVGHIERFNPAVETVFELIDGFDVIAMTARRLGPPVDRAVTDGVILDLMIHDVDVVLALAGSKPESIAATGCREGRYANAQMRFPDGTVGALTASRVTQRRVRELEITTENCLVVVDYLDQSVRIHRRSSPEYRRRDGDLRYRNESVVERPLVESEEPLKRELSAFVGAVRERSRPRVTAEEALDVLEVVRTVSEESEAGDPRKVRLK